MGYVTLLASGVRHGLSSIYFTLIKAFPDKDITLIESPNAPIIGVGESTLGQINNWLAFLGIKDKEYSN